MRPVPLLRTPALVIAALTAALGLLLGLGREARRGAEAGRGPQSAGGRVERCVSCHTKADEDPGGAHARAALGCESCHLGNALAFTRERAHAGLEREPGALGTVGRTCGREGCHAREAARVALSPMARNDGLVAVDRFAFGEIPAPDGHEPIAGVLAAHRPTPAQDHLRRLCAGCHLGTRRANRDDAIHGNGSGCAACHVARRERDDAKRPHPPVDSRVSDDRCLGCHSRSGRIALTYQGLYEVDRSPTAGGERPCPSPLALHDGRPVCRTAADVHFQAGMACVDCHLHTDLMGDGRVRAHKEEQVETRCETCHARAGDATGALESTWGNVADEITRDLLRLRGEVRPAAERVRLGARGTPMWSLRPSPAGWTLTRKLGGESLAARATPSDAEHTLPGHERLSCSSCHAAWAPTCASCHTAFDRSGRQWSFASAKEEPGAWVETGGGFAAEPPSLGVRVETVVPIVPGMILTVATGELGPGGPGVVAPGAGTGGRTLSRRLYSPLEPHATGRQARTCASCHRADTLPESFSGTRTDLRPLDAAERAKVLGVGDCLPCHAKASDAIYRDLGAARAELSRPSRCRLPATFRFTPAVGP